MTQLLIPEMGSDSQAELIEILVAEGDNVELDQSTLVLESDKATIEVPANQAGKLLKLLVKVGDKFSGGEAYADIDADDFTTSAPASVAPSDPVEAVVQLASVESDQTTKEEMLLIPEMGSDSQAEVIEILVSVGDELHLDQSVLVLESDKATIEVPADKAGVLTQLLVKIGDKFSGGEPYAAVQARVSAEASQGAVKQVVTPVAIPSQAIPSSVSASSTMPVPTPSTVPERSMTSKEVYAGPAVRKLARELGVDLAQVKGSGTRHRIQKEDVHQYVKQALKNPSTQSGTGIPAVPVIDFGQFGTIRSEPLNNVKRATAKAMTIANLNVPQVTQFDQADITELEAFRIQQNQRFAKEGIKFSLVPFVMKALARCLQEFPQFNASLSPEGDALILKEYISIGVAVDTPKGLLVPVIREVGNKSVTQIRQELQDKAELARLGKLSLADMQGASFSLSSLGGIGGTAFTPIVNTPEAAILGLSKSTLQPVWDGEKFAPRLMLPLSLSYDHRIIDGAEAARFSQRLVDYLQDLKNLLM